MAFDVEGLGDWFLFGEEVKAVVTIFLVEYVVVIVDFLFDLLDVQFGRDLKLIIVFI